jgi:biopolymer transport protein TolR
MAFQIDQNEDEDLADINIIPLVDVMLVLLIVFMITAPLSLSGVKVELPAAKGKGSGSFDDKKVVLSIDDKGRYFFDKVEADKKSIEAKIKAIFEHRQEKVLFIRADRRVVYEKVMDAMSAARSAGVVKISMLTVPRSGGS